MRNKKLKTLLIISLAIIVFAVFITLSFSSKDFNITLDKPQNNTKREESSKIIILDAENLFGSNISKLAANNIAQYIILTNPQATDFNLDGQQIKQQLISSVANQLLTEIKVYTENDLKLVDDSDANIKNYLDKLLKSYNLYLKDYQNYDIMDLALKANSGDEDSRKLILNFINNSKLALNEIQGIPTPLKFKDVQIQYLNLLSQLNYLSLSLLMSKNDPLRYEFAINAYEVFKYDYQNYITEFNKLLKENNLNN
jgi:hypothetical protein